MSLCIVVGLSVYLGLSYEFSYYSTSYMVSFDITGDRYYRWLRSVNNLMNKKLRWPWGYTVYIYTDQNYKRNTIVLTPIYHELNSKIENVFYVHKRPISLKYCSQTCS